MTDTQGTTDHSECRGGEEKRGMKINGRPLKRARERKKIVHKRVSGRERGRKRVTVMDEREIEGWMEGEAKGQAEG